VTQQPWSAWTSVATTLKMFREAVRSGDPAATPKAPRSVDVTYASLEVKRSPIRSVAGYICGPRKVESR